MRGANGGIDIVAIGHRHVAQALARGGIAVLAIPAARFMKRAAVEDVADLWKLR